MRLQGITEHGFQRLAATGLATPEAMDAAKEAHSRWVAQPEYKLGWFIAILARETGISKQEISGAMRYVMVEVKQDAEAEAEAKEIEDEERMKSYTPEYPGAIDEEPYEDPGLIR